MAVSSLEFNKRLKMPVVTDRIMPSDSPFLLNFRDTILKGEDLFPQLVHRSSNAKIPNQLKKQLKINDKFSLLSNFKRVLSDGETSITKKNKVLCTTNLDLSITACATLEIHVTLTFGCKQFIIATS